VQIVPATSRSFWPKTLTHSNKIRRPENCKHSGARPAMAPIIVVLPIANPVQEFDTMEHSLWRFSRPLHTAFGTAVLACLQAQQPTIERVKFVAWRAVTGWGRAHQIAFGVRSQTGGVKKTHKATLTFGQCGSGEGIVSPISVPSAAKANDSRAISSIVGQF
jgi:hypothetical protein